MPLVNHQEAEMTYLGCILKDGSLIQESKLRPENFHSRANQKLFDVFRHLERRGEPIDLVTTITLLGNDLSNIGGKKYLSELVNSVASTEPFHTYEKHILEAWKLRKANDIVNKGVSDLSDISNLMKGLSELEQDNKKDYNHKDALVELYDRIEKQEKGMSGIDTGFEGLNRILDGFQRGDLIISAARPSVGKTAKMLSHAIKHAENGGVVFIASLEMGYDMLNTRMLSAIGNIDLQKMKNPKQYFDSGDWERFGIAFGKFSDMNIHIDETPGQTVSDIRSNVMSLKKEYPNTPMLILIDYLQLIRPDGRAENKNIEVGEITRSLKELAKETESPVYLLSQLSRGVEQRQDKRPRMSDIRDSGSIEQDADVIEFLYREDYYDQETDAQNIIEVIIAKQRNGAVGTIELAYIKEYNLFADLAHEY